MTPAEPRPDVYQDASPFPTFLFLWLLSLTIGVVYAIVGNRVVSGDLTKLEDSFSDRNRRDHDRAHRAERLDGEPGSRPRLWGGDAAERANL